MFTKSLNYDPLNDFRAIIEMARATWSLAVTPSFPAKNAKEFVAYVKANPGKVSYATPGLATPHFISMELLKRQAGLDMLHVPYSGQAQAVTDVIGGHVPVMSFPTHVALPLARENKLRMIGVFADKRVDMEPSMPTMTEEGFPVSVDVWYGFMAPAKTPDAIVAKYNNEIGQILKLPHVREALEKQSLDGHRQHPRAARQGGQEPDRRMGQGGRGCEDSIGRGALRAIRQRRMSFADPAKPGVGAWQISMRS